MSSTMKKGPIVELPDGIKGAEQMGVAIVAIAGGPRLALLLKNKEVSMGAMFRSREEMEEFIKEMRKLARDVWPFPEKLHD